jgi:mycothiol synthase
MTSKLEIPGAPALPGLIFRQFQGESDYPSIAVTLSASVQADGIRESVSVESVANTYQHLTNCDPARDMIIAEVDGAMVAYGRAWWYEQADGTFVYSHIGHVRDEWRRKGIGRAILHYLQSAMRTYAVQHPRERQHNYMTYVENDAPGRTQLLVQDGYQVFRYGYSMIRDLTAPLPEAPMPPGLAVRAVQPEHYRLIWDADTEAFRDHYGFAPPAETDYERWLSDPIVFTPELWCVAWDVDRDEIAGMVRSFIDHGENESLNRKRGYTEFISTRRPWRKRGLARSLLVQSMALLRALGMTEAALGVDAENPTGALQLYEGVGFQVHMKSTGYLKPVFGDDPPSS